MRGKPGGTIFKQHLKSSTVQIAIGRWRDCTAIVAYVVPFKKKLIQVEARCRTETVLESHVITQQAKETISLSTANYDKGCVSPHDPVVLRESVEDGGHRSYML